MAMMQRVREAVVRVAKTDPARVPDLPPLERSLLPVITLASTLYSAASIMRRRLYRYGFFIPVRLPVPVVSIGNITWGGNGKTPMVEFLSNCFLRAGICPLILTRGYAGGDEARLLKIHLEGSCAKVGVGPNRAAMAILALDQHGIMHPAERGRRAGLLKPFSKEQLPIPQQLGADGRLGVILLDDGMQHWNLTRDLEIVMVNLITLWGNKLVVPRGPMRESLEEMKRADVVVLHHADLVSEQTVENVKSTLQPMVRAESAVVLSRMAPRYLFRPPAFDFEARNTPEDIVHNSWPPVPLEAVRGSILLCVSGVGCPEAVALALEQIGADHVERMDYLDHHYFEDQELSNISAKVSELRHRFPDRKVLTILTEKDYIRDRAIWMRLNDVELLVLHSSLEIIPIAGDLEALTRMLSCTVV